ncbi:sulfotransferase, partial [Candidatus Pelagibacter sp.]|nr:sulfotransferase [Candidatus Pelagibacter sp.]
MNYEIGKLLINKKKFKKAHHIFSKLLDNKPNDFKANFQMGKMYYELNDLNKSIFYFKKSNKAQPNNPNILFNLALALQGTGEVDGAKKIYLDLILINSKDVKSYYGLFILDIKNITDQLLKNLEIIMRENETSLFEKSLINFMFSKLAKNKNNLKEEINFLKLAHQNCYNSNKTFNSQSDFYYKNIISNNFNKIIFESDYEQLAEFNNQSHIFIIGLPRSGSTLVETIISHNKPDINSVGEFHGFNRSILEQIGEAIYTKNFDYKNYKLKINRKKFQEALLEKYNNFEKKIYLDKSLENFFNIEIILEFFPNAKFIHTYRKFNDAVIGIYQTMLPELSWTHKIKDIINYMGIYNKTINHFKKKYPKRILDVQLDKLSNQKEVEVKKILNFCNIKYDLDYLNFDKNKKLSNKTSSFLQV